MRHFHVVVGLGVLSSVAWLTQCVGDSNVTPTDGGNDVTTNNDGGSDSASDVVKPPTCDAAATACGNACVDTQTDNANCGTCGTTCETSYTCTAGICGNVVTQIARGTSHNCILLHDGSVWCRGESDQMQLGETSAADGPCVYYTSAKCRAQYNKVTLAGAASQIIAAGTDSCAIVAQNLYCWGFNGAGQLGHANYTQNSGSPDKTCPGTANKQCLDTATQVVLADPVAQASTNGTTTCAVTTTGNAFCWGDGNYGMLGNGQENMATYTPFEALTGNVTEINVSPSGNVAPHVCAAKTDHTVWCWGMNNNGELGHAPGTNNDSSSVYGKWNHTPLQAGGLGAVNVKHVVGGPDFTCVLDTGGVLSCWGNNGKAIIAYPPAYPGDGGFVATPTAVANVPNLVAFSAAAPHACGVDTSNNVWCWGDTSTGAIGNGLSDQNPGTATACGVQEVCIGPTKLTGIAATDVKVGGNGLNLIEYQYGAGTLALGAKGVVSGWGQDNYTMINPAADAGVALGCGNNDAGVCYTTPVQAGSLP